MRLAESGPPVLAGEPEAAIFCIVRVVCLRCGAAVLAAALVACSVEPLEPPKAPPPRGESRTDVQHDRQRGAPPELIAPPPAYGNRVVLASRDRSEAVR